MYIYIYIYIYSSNIISPCAMASSVNDLCLLQYLSDKHISLPVDIRGDHYEYTILVHVNVSLASLANTHNACLFVCLLSLPLIQV